MILKKIKTSLPLQIVMGALLGIMLGAFFQNGELKSLTQVAKVAIHWVKLIAGPYLLVSIFLSLIQVQTKASVVESNS